MALVSAPLVQLPRTTTDFVGLAQLRAQAGRSGQQGGEVTAETARQFEALFVQMMLKSMRDAGDVFGDGSDRTYRDMFDQQIALEMTRGKGLGLADLLTRQLAPATATDNPAASTVRLPDANDVIAARPPAIATPPPSRVQITSPDTATLLAAVTAPGFDVETAITPTPSRRWDNWQPATPEDFIRDLWPHAQRAGDELGVDPRALVAQAALETGWGKQVSRDASGNSSNNLFNIKADTRWSGDRLAVRTLEFEGGLPKPTVASFRAYPDLETAFSDYVQFLKGNPRYTEALREGSQAGRFADSLQRAGYATDPGYAAKLRSIMASPRFSELTTALKNLTDLPKL